MSVNQETPIIAFLWRDSEITSAVVDAARRTRTRAIFDLSVTDLESTGLALIQADCGRDAVDLKISPKDLMNPALEEFLAEAGIDRVWIELHPLLLDEKPGPYIERMEALSGKIACIPIIADVALVEVIARTHPGIRNIALKGCEASGFVCSETLFTLYSTARSIAADLAEAPGFLVWGGVAAPEAAAAFLSAGARGIVFESLHWLTDLVAVDGDQRARISRLRPQHTDLTGLNLQVPCRLFNKGNSRAVKELKNFAASLCGAEIREEQRRFFAGRVDKEAARPLDSLFGRDELIPLGIEAAFAKSFADRFGKSTEKAIDGFLTEVESQCQSAGQRADLFAKSLTAEELGTRYPFVQGAMSWITDVPEFALKVAEAGALPTVALGLMNKEILDQRLGKLAETMGDRPYAVNVITLMENPYRDEQLAWIRAIRPRFTVIAAGEPSHAKELLDSGLDVIYIAPNEELLKMAFEAGVRYVICEGNEAGGHVGEHSTLTLAQVVLEYKHREPALFKGRRIILAGGVWNRETALMAAMLGADAVQMGTSYLATREIVETGALTGLYQRMIVESPPGGTVITGEGTGLRVRSLRTQKIDSVCALEREFSSGAEEEAAFRRKIETLTAGSLFIAARGLDRPDGKPLDPQTCVSEGQFMSGAVAGALKEIRTLAGFHAELAEGPFREGLPYLGPIREAAKPRVVGVDVDEAIPSRQEAPRSHPAYHSRDKERIAVTGMSIVNSLGNSPDEVWAASVASKTGIIRVPESKWNHEQYFNPRPRVPEKTYCKVGAFMNLEVSRKELGIAPQDFRTMTDSTRITMWLARRAIEESGILESDIPRERIGVLISQNSGEAAATLHDVIIRGSAKDIVSSVKRVVSLTPEAEQAIEDEVTSGRLVIDDTTLLGRLNCSAGGFICNKYGFMGPSFSVSAACATALVALYSAYQMIRNGIIDAAVVGGAEEFLTPIHYLEFSAIGALAGLSGIERSPRACSRPFDAGRDGMVLGEGGGMIIIERESVARKRGAKIHAYITAMGASNNNLGMVESSSVTQEIAIGAAFDDAPYGPEGVHLIECHATSTMQGDGEEVRALSRFYDPAAQTVLTSFKSQIGHTLGASGVNSLIRGVMAMKAGIFSPTLNYETPDPDINLESLGFVVLPQPAEWQLSNGGPRRLQVNAFGFGGSNYVVHVEQAMETEDRVLVSLTENIERPEHKTSDSSLPEGIYLLKTEIGGRGYRLAAVADSEREALSLIEKTDPVGEGTLPAKRIRALSRQGIYLGREEGTPPPLAFVFPGQGSHYAGMSHELYQTFPVIKHWMDRAAAVAEFDLLHLMFFDSEEDLQKTRWQQPALFTMEYAMVQYLVSLGITPAALAGHSLGELTALCLAGVYSFEDGFRIVNMRAVCMDKACQINVDPGVMMAVDAPLDYLEERLKGNNDIHITNINSPKQVVLGGDTEKVKAFGEELKQQGYRRTLLRVSMAFHSPIMRCIHDELDAFVATIEFHSPTIPVISNTTMMPFPSDTAEIKKIVMAHLESPVHWMQNVGTLWNDFGVRLFVEIGPRDVLSNMVSDIEGDAECIQTCLPSAESLMFRTAMAQLYAKGHLKPAFEPRFVNFPKQGKAARTPGAVPAITTTRQPLRPIVGTDPLQWIVQREINSFVLESFGRFLRPSLLAAIRREHDSSFTDEDLSNLLRQLAPGFVTIPTAVTETITMSAAPVQAVALGVRDQVSEETETAEAVDPGTSDVTETVIQIIMDATGYERDEIDAGMDLREDLSIRSSRLPVIMDALENRFGIKIEIEDFMDVRTIADISQKISEVADRTQKPIVSQTAPSRTVVAAPVAEDATETAEEKKSIKRMVFSPVHLEKGTFQPIEIDTMESVIIFTAKPGTSLAKETGDAFRRDYGVSPVTMTFMEQGSDGEDFAFDLRSESGVEKAVQNLRDTDSLAGMVFIMDDPLEAYLADTTEISHLLAGFFGLLKAFVDSPSKKFVILIRKGYQTNGPSRVLAEGILGMFLSLTHEFSSVQFRTVLLDDKTDSRVAIRGALDRSRKVIETMYREGEVFTSEGLVVPSVFKDAGAPGIGSDDVVVFSGGAYGITFHLAGSLIPFGCHIVFLGRTKLDPDIDFRALLDENVESDEALAEVVRAAKPGISGDALKREISSVSKALEIVRNVEEIRSQGIDAAYYSCDVTDPLRTKSVMDEIFRRYGRINGIVHGAGVIKDNFIKQMTPADFSAVVDVKLIGAWNLYTAAQKAGLKFFVCLSSAAAIQGNPGQVNYSTGNRTMSALMSDLRGKDDAVIFKALMLPPIEGTGMADDPEIRALMKRMNADYVHVAELSGLFTRELLLAPKDDVWVLFMRSLPDVKTVRLDFSEPTEREGVIEVGTVAFESANFPMIDAVTKVDIGKGELTATRVFSRERDLWIADHKPFKFLKHPPVSAIMVLETFMEAAKTLNPHLLVRGIRDAQFIDIVECPQGVDRSSVVSCNVKESSPAEVVCAASLAAREISPSGQILNRMYTNFKADVIMGCGLQPPPPELPGFPIALEELETRPMFRDEVLEKYARRSEMQERYLVIQELDGTCHGAIRGKMIYRESEDFAPPRASRYQYSPYVLEALMQMTNFYLVMRDEDEERSIIPYHLEEASFYRKCADGEEITLEGRLKEQTDQGVLWDSRASDQEGRTIMHLRGLMLKWFTA